MTPIIKSKTVLVALLLAFTFAAKSQNAEKANSKNSISFMFSNYTSAMDSEVTDMLQEIKGVTVVFSCVQAGLVIVESEEMAGVDLKQKLTNMFVENEQKVKFDLVEAYSEKPVNHSY